MAPFFSTFVMIAHKLFFAFCGIFGVGFVIGFHELGHFMFAKLFNIEIPSFSIGFGPKLVSKQIGETEFSLSAIPLGGYVEIGGAAEEQGPLTDRSFARKPWYQKMLVMIGGIGFNIIFAYIALSILFILGMPASPLMYPRNATTTIAAVSPESAAARAGLIEGDTITHVNNEPLINTQEFIETIIASPQMPFSLTVQHADNSQDIITVITGDKEMYGKKIGTLGIVFGVKNLEPQSFINGIAQGFTTTNTMIKNTFYAYKHIISKKDASQVGGPLMIISETITGASKGVKILVLFLAFISISLAILNLIPLPILDGGQMLFYSIEALIRRPIPFNVRWYIHVATWIAFLLLTVYLSIKDISRIASPYIEHITKFFGF